MLSTFWGRKLTAREESEKDRGTATGARFCY